MASNRHEEPSRRDVLKGLAALEAMRLTGCAAPATAGGSTSARNAERIRNENAKRGTRDWMLTSTRVDPATKYRCPWVEGYCSAASVRAGYAQEHRGWLPAPGAAWAPYPEDWVHWQPNRDAREGTLFRYLGDGEVLKCPAGVPERSRNLLFGGTEFPAYPYSYSVNVLMTGYPQHTLTATPGMRWKGGPKFTQILSPSQKVLVIEEDVTGIDDAACRLEGAPSSAPRDVALPPP